MACVKCEMEIPAGTVVCPYCKAIQPTPEEAWSRQKTALLVALASAILLFGVPWVLYWIHLSL
jgi:predicted nucleic acid-binding Zn ribbon protein